MFSLFTSAALGIEKTRVENVIWKVNYPRSAVSCPQHPFCPVCPLSWALATQPTVRLPAVKVTLPAAMDYTGTQSQAEYDTALEGRSEAGLAKTSPLELIDPPWPASAIMQQPLVKSWMYKGRKEQKISRRNCKKSPSFIHRLLGGERELNKYTTRANTVVII